ncbi:spore germination protein [Metabacillus idriensis]|uniref:GerAB/ArcD/ProY family transporter n=1 Tax=Metabacillus idriensis TaxID=324768 RepID=A0A6I2M6D0_9BACI|nr:GerAB/ArcD/ProY family transporter [Metabacillus idriensis]MCM3595069.1 spore germination protein [Metabacillus idriensis]MRX52904.1 GerAB/ArcD/ProY family transporter [Metabacillus idriensis]OHR65530.1 spore gernimation protein GerB [Bacillus sp. HMSC76G11]
MFPLPKDDKKVSNYFVFYLIHTMQIGVGILGFERYIAKSAGHSSWIAIITSGITILVLIWISYLILNRGKNDIVAIHHQIFGKWIGGIFSFYFIIYYAMFVLVLIRTYVEVIQVWVFPDVYHWVFIAIIILICYSYVTGGFRIVTGIAFLGVIYGIPLLFVKYFPIRESYLGSLLPVFDLSFKELLSASKGMTLNYLGFEVLFMFYPFIKDPPKSQKWAHYAVLFSMFIYLLTALVSFAYFDQNQLKTTIWATLTLWKIVDLTIIERFEYVGISLWFFVVLPNMCIGLWSASRGMHRLFSMNQRNALRIICLIIFIAAVFLKDREQIDLLNNNMSEIGFYTIYGYIPLLFILQLIIMKVRNKK